VNVKEAEALLALNLEVETALTIGTGSLDDLQGRFAAERAIERVFQATEMVDEWSRERHFGAIGIKRLRGMRNRLAHNYLDIDLEIIRKTLRHDLPGVRERLFDDCEVARAIVTAAGDGFDEVDWILSHYASTGLAPTSCTDDSEAGS
jgi:uncharacterized protein with HEPN domain